MRVLMAAPFDANGRYQGGISSVANTMMMHQATLATCGLDICKFNTCRINRSAGTDATIGLDNIKNSVLLYTTICSAIKDSKAEVLYYHSSLGLALLKDLLVIRHAKRKTGIKTAIHIHYAEYDNIMTGNGVIDGLILKILKDDVDEVVFLSKATMESFIEHGLVRGKCNVIYNFTTLDVKTPPKELIHQDNHPMKLLFVGDIGDRKGFFDLAEVMKDLNDTDIELHVCGAPRNSESKEKFTAYQERLGKKLIFHGFVTGDEKEQIFTDADILVLPSYGEGLPMVIMEALSAGCAVISTNVGSIPEIIQADNGILIQPGDKEALKKAIRKLAENEDSLKKIQSHNIEYAKIYTCDNFIGKINEVCRKEHR